VLAVALAAACAGSCGGGGVTLSGTTLTTRDTSYRIGELDRGWHRVDVDDQNDAAFAREDGTIIQVNSTCSPELDIPLVALTNHLLIGFTERDIRDQRLVELDAREALRTHVVAKLDGVPRELELVVMKKDGCVYDLALVAAPGGPYGAALSAWEPFLAAFHAEREAP